MWKKLQDNNIKTTDFVGTQKAQGCGFDYDGENEGHGGMLAADIASQNLLDGWLKETKPDIVMMHLGTNDAWSNRRPEDTIQAFDKLVDQMRSSKDTMKILVSEREPKGFSLLFTTDCFQVAQIIPLNPDGCPECGRRVETLNNAVVEWAPTKSNDKSTITVVDCHKDFDVKAMTRDGVHPNDKGDEWLANAWYEPLAKAIKG